MVDGAERRPRSRCSPRCRTSRTCDVAELAAAVRAAGRSLVERGPARSARPPPSAAPWIAHGTTCSRRQKDGAALARGLVQAKAVVLARRSAPHQVHVSVASAVRTPRTPMAAVCDSRARGRPDRAGAARAGAAGAGSRTCSASTSSSCASTSRWRTGAAPRTRSARRPRRRCARRASGSRRRRSRRRARTTSAAPTASCARRSTAR